MPSPMNTPKRRRGHANGFKPKVVHAGLGKIPVNVPQVRGNAIHDCRDVLPDDRLVVGPEPPRRAMIRVPVIASHR